MKPLEEQPPVEVGRNRRLAMSLEFIGAAIGVVAVTVAAWIGVMFELKSTHAVNVLQDRRLELIESRSELQRDVLYELRADMKTNREQLALVIKMIEANRTISRE